MNHEFLVSVIIPTRDRPLLATCAVRSVLAQTYPRLEVFLVDDGSESPVVLPADIADDRRLSLIRLDRSIGVGLARDLAIEQSRGELLAFCDDDDEWLPRKTEEQVTELIAHPEAVAVESGYEMRDGDRVVSRYLPAQRDAFRTLLLRPIMAPTVVMTRTAAVIEAGGFGQLSRTQDWDLWLRMTPGRSVIALPRYHAIRRDHPPVSSRIHYVEHRGIVDTRVKPALEELPPAERARILAYHDGVLGSYAAGAGSRRLARRHFLKAWRQQPSNVAPLIRIWRTVLGEMAWRAMVDATLVSRRSIRRLMGRDPFLQRF